MSNNDNTDHYQSKNKRKQRRKELIKNDIISVAEKYFLNADFDDVMIDQLVTISGYSKATIYNYFNSKEEIFLGIFIRAFDALIETFQNFSFETGLLSLGQGYLLFVDNYPHYAKLFSSHQIKKFTNTLHSKELNHEDLNDLEKNFREKQMVIASIMTNVINQSFQGLDSKPSVDPMTLIIILSYLNSTIMDLILIDQEQGKSHSPDSHVSVLFQLLAKGLRYFET